MAKNEQQTETKATPRWSLGLFRNDYGRLVTCYVRADGTPVPSEAKRVGDSEILHHDIFRGMKYSEARQQLLADAEEQKGLVDEDRDPNALPDDFPGFKVLEAAGITTVDDLKAVEDLTEIDGIGAKTVEQITEALEAK